MFQKLKQSSGKIAGFKLSGKITDREFKAFVADVEKVVADEGSIRLFLTMDYPQKFDPKAAWDDVIFWIGHIRDIERLAIVGQREWEKWIELFSRPFIRTEVRYYSKLRLQEAWTWLSS
jgi:hypothetical protein